MFLAYLRNTPLPGAMAALHCNKEARCHSHMSTCPGRRTTGKTRTLFIVTRYLLLTRPYASGDTTPQAAGEATRRAPVQGDGRHSDDGAQLAGRVLAHAAGRGRAGRGRLVVGRRRRRIAVQLQALVQVRPPLRSDAAGSHEAGG